MTVTIDQALNGLERFANSELIPRLPEGIGVAAARNQASEYNLNGCITISILVCYVKRLKELSRHFDYFFSSN